MKKYLLAGLLVWIPIAVTIWLLTAVFGSLNSIFKSLILWFHGLIGVDVSPLLLKISGIPGIGLLVIITVILTTGLFAGNIVGQWWIDLWDKFINRIPIVKSIYSTVKQISDTLLSDNGQSFKEAVLIEYPRQGIWTIAFVTGTPDEIISPSNQDNTINSTKEYISVFVPTTPNPTSGFLLIVDKNNVKTLDLSVEQALKYIVSMGVLHVESNNLEANEIVQISNIQNN
ncbi:MAG: hypothetical protein RLZZ210_1296 [Pseudomonadota bacterium]|jgi:uncharacterized membrane protein